MKQLTIGFPIFNEGQLVGDFLRSLDESCASMAGFDVDLVIVNDGCSDDSMEWVRRASLKEIAKITVINLARNYGHQNAVQCLVEHLNSPLNVIMDADFQDDPKLIPIMIERMEKAQSEIVRVSRTGQGGSILMRPLFYGFRRLYRFLTGEKYSFGTFGLYSSKALQFMRSFSNEAHFYFPGVVSLVGLKTEVLHEARPERKSGKSKVGLKRLFRLAFDAFFSFSVFPIRLASFFGFIITTIGLIGVCVIVYLKLFTTLAIPGWSSILSAVTFFGGVQLLFLGILGEYVARIFEQVKGRPHYFVESVSTINKPNVPTLR